MKPLYFAILAIGVLIMLKSSQAPRNVRNNNPLNIKVTSDQWEGMTGDDGTFVKFDSPEWGFRAAYKILQRYMNVYGLRTIHGIITRWAPESDNNHTANYIEYIATKMATSPAEPLNESELPELMLHMSVFEGSQGAFEMGQALAGVQLARSGALA